MDLWNIYKTLVIAVGSGYQSAIFHCIKSARILKIEEKFKNSMEFPLIFQKDKYT